MKDSVLFDSTYINELNELAQQIKPSLVTFAYYSPKRLPKGASDGEAFWIAVTNLYTLLFDCGKQIFARHYNSDGDAVKAVITTLCEFGYVTNGECESFTKFAFALRELRSYFCHNKHIDVGYSPHQLKYISPTLERLFSVDPLRENAATDDFDYAKALSELKQQTAIHFTVLENGMRKALSDSINQAAVIEKWERIFAYWLIFASEFEKVALSKYYEMLYYECCPGKPMNWRYRSKFVSEVATHVDSKSNLKKIIANSTQPTMPVSIFLSSFDMCYDELRNIMQTLVFGG